MRVAMLGNFPLNPEQVPGGVEAVIRNLAVAMAPMEGIDLHLVSCNREITREETKEYAGFTIHYLPGQRKFGNLTNHFLDRKRLVAAINELKPDIVHSHGTDRYVAAGQCVPFPDIATVHGIRYREVILFGGLKGWIRKVSVIRMEKQVLSRAKHIFVIADYVSQAIAPYSTGKQYPIANPVAAKYFGLETTDEKNTILSVAAIQPRKGIIHLVEALGLVRKEFPNARLKLIGKVLTPEYAQEVKNKIVELGLSDAVEMVGFVTDEELEHAFTSCSVFTLCSIEESSPVSIAEAMTLGKPVVATAVGGVPDLVSSGKTGFLVDFGDVNKIAASLTRVLKDPGLRAQMGAAARTRAQKDFHPSSAAEKTVEVYKQVISANGGEK